MIQAMKSFNIHFAKTHLSRLVEEASDGEPFIIAKAGKPMVKVVPIDMPAGGKAKRIGFMAGMATVPAQEEFNAIGANEIAAMFGGDQ